MFIKSVIKLFKMANKFDFDYIIIGSGPAGTSAALSLANLTRKRIAIVEAGEFGGSNISSRDLPYSVGLKFSKLYNDAKNAGKFGISGMNLHFNFPTAVSYQEKISATASKKCQEELEKAKITLLHGTANFLDANTIAVDKRQFTSVRFIIATGARLAAKEITGVDSVEYFTPNNALKIRRLPKAVCVVGAGTTGCEIAQYFAELGVKTLLIERSGRILPREDEEVGAAISEHFSKNLGITVLPSTRVVALEQDHISKRVVVNRGGQEKMARVDTIVLATGSEPVVDLGLENARVKYKNSGIVVDKTFQTSAKNIYAIGDVIGGESSTSIASYQGNFLAASLATKSKALPSYAGFTRVISTHPEVAVIGYNEDDLLKRDRKYRKEIVRFSDLPAVSACNDINDGFVKILADKSNKIIGATIVAPNASLMAQELAMAIRHNLGLLEIASTPHGANSLNNAIVVAAKKILRKK